MIVVAYTDASHCHKNNVSACGYCVLVNGKMVKHEVTLVGGLRVSDQAEAYAVTAALQYAFLIQGVKSITINTDWRTVTTMKEWRLKKYFTELYDTIEIIREHRIGLTLTYVRGHSNNELNNLVDKSCLKTLRQFINQNK